MLRVVIRALIYLQPLFWILILRLKKNKGLNGLSWFIFPIWIIFFFTVRYQELSFEYYSTDLLMLYSTMVLGVFFFLQVHFEDKDALALSFLLVYFNSFYWESCLHLVALLHGEIVNTIAQAITHLYFIPILLYYLRINDEKKAIKLFIYGLIFTAICTLVIGLQYPFRVFMIRTFDIHLPRPQNFLRMLMRLGSLSFLTKLFISHVKIKGYDENEETYRHT